MDLLITVISSYLFALTNKMFKFQSSTSSNCGKYHFKVYNIHTIMHCKERLDCSDGSTGGGVITPSGEARRVSDGVMTG